MLGSKAEVETNEGQQKMQTAEMLIEHASDDFGVPVIDRSENHKHRASVDDVVEMGNNEVGVMNVNVKRNLCERDTSDSSEHEVHNEATGKQHSTVQTDSTSPECCQPIEEFDSGWNRDEGCRNREEQTHPGWSATGEHVVSPHHQSKNNDGHDRIHHGCISEQRLSAVNRKDFAHQAKGRQHHDVNRWVRIKPEKVLVNDNISSHSRIEKTRMSNNIEAQHNECAG